MRQAFGSLACFHSTRRPDQRAKLAARRFRAGVALAPITADGKALSPFSGVARQSTDLAQHTAQGYDVTKRRVNVDAFMDFLERQGNDLVLGFELNAANPVPKSVRMFEKGRDPYMARLLSLEVMENAQTGFASWQEGGMPMRSGGCAISWKEAA